MRPVDRRVRNYYGPTARRVAVRSQRPWYFQVLVATVFMAIGFAIAYWMLHDAVNMREKLHEATLENRDLEVKLVGAQRDLQLELATNNNLAKQLSSVQDENTKIKQDLLFYKNMLDKKLR